MAEYEAACEQLARVGEVFEVDTSLTPCSRGYMAQLGRGSLFIAKSPREAALSAIKRLAAGMDRNREENVDHYGHSGVAARADALTAAFEALGGDWRAA